MNAPQTSATFFFITDQRSADRTSAPEAEASSRSTTAAVRRLVYRAERPEAAAATPRTGRR